MSILHSLIVGFTALIFPLSLLTGNLLNQASAGEPKIVSVRKIWDKGRHNAFTDLVRFRGRWWCTFREGTGHAGDDGKVRVIVSGDGNKWQSAALLSKTKVDLRDPKLSVMPNGRLMLMMGGSVYKQGNYQTRAPHVSFSRNGRTWTTPRKLLAEDHWLWRVTWHKGTGYSVSKLGNRRDPRRVMLYRTQDGLRWEWLTEFRGIPAWPNEATIRFLENDEMIVLLRRNQTAWIGTSRPPYTQWHWKDTGQQIGGPNFLRLPNGSLWAAGRSYGKKPTTVLARMTRDSYKPVLTLPSGGDCSYPGMVWHGGLLWMSYYSSHAGKTSIYLAKIKIPAKESTARRSASAQCRLNVTITSDLPSGKMCADPLIDFAHHIAQAKLTGHLDPNSIRVVNLDTGKVVPHALSRHFQHGDKGRVQWVIDDRRHVRYEIRFRTAAQRPLCQSPSYVPLIGVGDLLRYNAKGKVARPIGGLTTLSRLVDLTGDGREDLVYAGMYTYHSGWPEKRIPADWGGIFCRPRIGGDKHYLFGDPIRLRYKNHRNDAPFHDFAAGYMHADVADLNGDKLPDLLFTTAVKSSQPSRIKHVHRDVHFFLNSGDRDAGGMPIFLAAGRTPHPKGWWGPVRAVDLSGDGVWDLVFGSMWRDSAGAKPDTSAYLVKNKNRGGWPFHPAQPVRLDVGRRPCFYDVDGDKRHDSVCLVKDPRARRLFVSSRLAWRKNVGGDPPRFGPAQILGEVELAHGYFTAAVRQGPHSGILVSYDAWQRAALLQPARKPTEKEGKSERGKRPTFVTRHLLSPSAALALGDQSTPFPCDWDGDGDWDLLVGGGYGHVRIVINSGTNHRPRFEQARPVLSAGRPLVLHMSRVFPGLNEYHHDMGYPHPAFVDWDADGLRDLLVPNITNRIFWYKNIGTKKKPRFGRRQQIICDGFPESPRTLRATARLLGADTKQWKKRVPDAHSPFGWRSRAGFGDFNGDGLLDMVTTDARANAPNGYAERSAIFVQYRDQHGRRRLRRDRVITLPNGSALKNVAGQPAQTIPVDWDGDGRLDLIINHGRTMNTAPALVRNIGTKTDPRFDFPTRLKCWGIELSGIAKHGPYYGIGDLDGDNRPDLLACPEMGTYHFYRRTALDMPRRPSFRIVLAAK